MKFRFSPLIIIFIILFSSLSFARGEWVSVRSKNFFLISDAKEENIRQVATKLEQFREVFGKLFPDTKFNSANPVNVIVFRDDYSYAPFKPKTTQSEAREFVAGYFQPGETVNYITLSISGDMNFAYETIFHEYVHFLINSNFGKTEIPPWVNEGLADYYQTFSIKENRIVTLGNVNKDYLRLLKRNSLIPLRNLFAVDNYSLQQNSHGSRTIFYAQSWFLVHYLMHGGFKKDDLDNFIKLVMKDSDPEKAFQQVFKMNYSKMEQALKNYSEQKNFPVNKIAFKEPLTFDTNMAVASLSEAEANAYLGDLLYNTNDFAKAEIYLKKALAINPDQSLANSSFGLVKMRQNNFDEAKKYLQKGVEIDPENYLIQFNYAYVISRENMSESGVVSSFPATAAKIMRRHLRQAIQLNPVFTDSYKLLAFINFVNNENLDEALTLLNKSLSIKPGDQDNLLLLAQIYFQTKNYTEAKNIAEKLLRTGGDDYIHSNSESLLKNIRAIEERQALNEKRRPERIPNQTVPATDDFSPPKLVRRKNTDTEKKPTAGDNQNNTYITEEEVKRLEKQAYLKNIKDELRGVQTGEKQTLGIAERVECQNNLVIFHVKIAGKNFKLKTNSPQSVIIRGFTTQMEQIKLGCGVKFPPVKTVITYRPDKNSADEGEAVALEFVPDDFEM